MSDNTEPVVTQEDRDAADQLRIYLLRKMDLELEDDVIGEFEKHFAAHRADAVAKREKEIRDKFLRVFDAAIACASVVTGYEKRINAVEQFDELRAAIRQLQTGGGA